jgi:polar amino acid transport system substrate-binding protein
LVLSACTPISLRPTSRTAATASPTPFDVPKALTPPTNLVHPGTITFLTDTNYPPQESIDPATNKAVGFDIDIADALAEKLGLTATIERTGFPQIIKALLDKKGDAIISALAITPELQRQVAFVGYFQSGQSILVKKGNPAGIGGLADLCGKTVAVEVNTAEQNTLDTANGDVCKANKINIRIYPTDVEAITKLKQGAVDAAMDDSPVAANFVKQAQDQLELAGAPIRPGPEGIAVDPKNPDLLRALQQAMLAIYQDGTYHQILVKWGLVDGEIPASQIIVSPIPHG